MAAGEGGCHFTSRTSKADLTTKREEMIGYKVPLFQTSFLDLSGLEGL